jgi:hypothetical protein
MAYTVTDTETLRTACINNNWFMHGTSEQYEKLFYANRNGFTISEIATIIWLCSDSKWYVVDIIEELDSLREAYERTQYQEW